REALANRPCLHGVGLIPLMHCVRSCPGKQINPTVVVSTPDPDLAPVGHLQHVIASVLSDSVACRCMLVAHDQAVPASQWATELAEGRGHHHVCKRHWYRAANCHETTWLSWDKPVARAADPGCRARVVGPV